MGKRKWPQFLKIKITARLIPVARYAFKQKCLNA
jgi:hypothetical protein